MTLWRSVKVRGALLVSRLMIRISRRCNGISDACIAYAKRLLGVEGKP